MSNHHDEDDWSQDSASLFREARRAHDPTLAESARLAAVLERMKATNAEAASAANHGADVLARGATSKLLRLVASVSVGVACIAAATYAFMRDNRHPSEPARSAEPPTAEVAKTPPPTAMQPAPKPSDELSASAQASAAPDETPTPPRSQRRVPPATVERQRPSRIEAAAVPEASGSTPSSSSTSATEPDNSATPNERPEPRSTGKAVTSIQEATPRATSLEPDPPEAVPATAAMPKELPTPPENAGTELAMMKRIQTALRDSEFSTALALCAEHAENWPHGVFELEREGVRAIASCGGNSDDAALRAQRFLTAHRHAPVAMRVSAACAAQLKKR